MLGEMMQYPKNNSLYKRDPKTHTFLDELSEEAFGNIKRWSVQEKIDGTNIRIHITKDEAGQVSFRIKGRNEDSQIPKELNDYIYSHMMNLKIQEMKPFTAWLFGEGCGPKIQTNGHKYSLSPTFMLFDVFMNGNWCSRADVELCAHLFGFRTPQYFPIMTMEEAEAFVKTNPFSISSIDERIIEGVICRAYPMVLNIHHSPLMFKLKCCDFDKEK